MLSFSDDELLVDYTKDFFSFYPEYTEFFRGVPSSHMWSLAYLYHPKSPLRELPLSKIYEEINRIATEPFNPEDYPEHNKKFNEYNTTYAQRLLLDWKKDLEDRREFMNTIKFSEENYTIKEAMMKNNKAMWDGYIQAEEQLSKENGSRTSGNQEESLVEKGDI